MGWNQAEHQHDGQQRRGGYHAQRGGIDVLGLLALFAHEAEEGGLHAVGQHDDEYRHIGIDIGDDAIFTARGCEPGRLDGHQQEVDESRHDARQSVDGGVLQKAGEQPTPGPSRGEGRRPTPNPSRGEGGLVTVISCFVMSRIHKVYIKSFNLQNQSCKAPPIYSRSPPLGGAPPPLGRG